MQTPIPTMSYCGPPPLPDDLWGRWNLDPLLLAGMVLAAGLYLWRFRGAPRHDALFVAGMAVLAVIFISPLCALTVALFSARVVHHVLLVAVAAPLLAAGLVGHIAPPRAATASALLTPLLLLHTLVFWLWHIPDAYALALRETPVYWAMQATLLGSAALFWGAVLLAPAARAIGALVAVTVQMGLLGAVLVFAGAPLYAAHFATTAAFGLDAHADQQLAGLIMWVPASLPYLLVALLRLAAVLKRAEAGRA